MTSTSRGSKGGGRTSTKRSGGSGSGSRRASSGRGSGARRQGKRRATTTRRRRGGGNLLLWGLLGGLVVLFVAIAVVSRAGTPEITDASAQGEALPTFQRGVDAAVGQPAPTLTGRSLEGEEMTIEPGDGTPRAIVFLAHWCPHCQREVPVVQDWLDAGEAPEDVEIVAVSTGIDRNRPNFPPQDWLEREGWSPRTLVDGDDAAARAYGLATYPYWVLVDGDGNVVERWSGESSIDQIEARLSQVAGGTTG